jgi:hypothetical protein
MTPERVLQAARLIRSGEVIELSYPISKRSHGARRYEMYPKRTDVGTASNQPQNTEDLVVVNLGHIGTQLDGFAHQAIGNSLYNCFKLEPIGNIRRVWPKSTSPFSDPGDPQTRPAPDRRIMNLIYADVTPTLE